jgi:hypothetical protein
MLGMSRVAITMVSMEWLEEVSIGGDGRSPAQLGFRHGEKLEEEEESDAVVRAGAFIRRRSVPRHEVEPWEVASETKKPSTASCYLPCEKKR